MKQPDEGREWVRRWTASVAETLKTARGRMSAQQLSERCAELGYPIPRSTITNLEIGRKESISIQEVAILAKALGIPPLALLFPIGHDQTFEVLPDTVIPTWLAAQWFSGEAPFSTPLDGGGWGAGPGAMPAWKNGSPQIFRKLYRGYDDWIDARRVLREAREARADAVSEKDREKAAAAVAYQEAVVRGIEEKIGEYRRSMRVFGFDPGPPPPALAHIDESGDHDNG